MSIVTAICSANKFWHAKFVSHVILNIAAIVIFSPFSYGQTIKNKFPKFQLDSLTSHYSNNYLGSIFGEKIADSIQIVALGEVSHGGYEPIAFKANMVRYLIESKGYRKVLFELSDIGRIRAMRNYLNNQSINDTSYITKWIKQAQFVDATASECLNLFKWIKQYNIKHPKDIVEVVGFEIGKDQSIINFILNKYIIPYDHKQGQQYVYQLSSDISDTAKIMILNKWVLSAELLLKTKISGEELYWLHFYIHNAVNGVNYLIRDSKSKSDKSDAANLFRDSVMSENVRYLSANDKTIVWAHNAHVIRSEPRYMGNYLNQYFKNRYYVVATDFSKLAEVEINNNNFMQNDNRKYVTKTFKSGPSTAAYKILNKYEISEGIFVHQDMINMGIKEETNTIDANGLQVFIPVLNNAFDALVIFSEIYSTAKQISN
ncbi:erythromycin esterase family protein [Mucilaginibacter dorajii]|uniref:Erythromycin esterase n=1 Tax=Mucilaginibacter dorajii TaxID=692994 RepID=A0ABP7R3E6_9SPHI|nr:erythromycin esterase family protein [Mucilaginibacter dorajii]MCS3738006.1 hypothetical protein [Mucilaginibacter dorajii]